MSTFGRNKGIAGGYHFATLILRLSFGGLMLTHGYQKLLNYNNLSEKFMDFLGMGSELSLILTIGSELGCAILLLLGLFTRFAAIPLIFTMLVATFLAHGNDPLADKEMALLYLSGYFSILFLGAGKYSLDHLIFTNKKLRKR